MKKLVIAIVGLMMFLVIFQSIARNTGIILDNQLQGETRVTTVTLNLRQSAPNGDILEELPAGTEVCLTGKTFDQLDGPNMSWVEVKVLEGLGKGLTGWVCRSGNRLVKQ